MSKQWVYAYDAGENRIGLVEAPRRTTQLTTRHVSARTRDEWYSDVWLWGNPLHKQDGKTAPKSYSDALTGSRWAVTRQVTRLLFWQAYQQWRDCLGRNGGNADILYDVYRYSIEAKKAGIRNVQEYVAERIERSQQMVSLYQRMIDIDELEGALLSDYLYNGEFFHSISEDVSQQWQPTERQIRNKMASIPRICALGYQGCSQETRNGKVAYCYPCHKKLAKLKDKVKNGTLSAVKELKQYEWLEEEAQRIYAEHRRRAIEACYEDYYGTMSLDEADNWLHA